MAGYIESEEQKVRRRARQRAQKAELRAAPGYVRPVPSEERREWDRGRKRRKKLEAMQSRLAALPDVYDVTLLPWSTVGSVSVVDPEDFGCPMSDVRVGA